MRKIFYSLGAVAAVATPIIATVSCGSDETTKKDSSSTGKQYPAVPTKIQKQVRIKQEIPTPIEQKVPTPVLPEQKTPSLVPVVNDNQVTIDVRIPDFDQEAAFDEKTYDATKFIEFWKFAVSRVHGVRTTSKTHMMVPYVIDREFTFNYTTPITLGGMMDELNKTGDFFKFNAELASAGEMGRFLMGIKKSDEALSRVKDLNTESYWGMHYEDNGYNDMIMSGDEHQSYISLSSPNNAQTVLDSHVNFDPNESFYQFDQRLPKGVDGIHVNPHDIFYLNLWRMI